MLAEWRWVVMILIVVRIVVGCYGESYGGEVMEGLGVVEMLVMMMVVFVAFGDGGFGLGKTGADVSGDGGDSTRMHWQSGFSLSFLHCSFYLILELLGSYCHIHFSDEETEFP